ncbi:type IV toxin-antitoxin system AbiEi family antitoxin [Nocardioides zeae]|uniref:Transcriptional regulator n=1 Tax=Nocardioides zeae TaxID=1457234 RepID=A0A6P0HI45_9ACTN|nr:type IV toxin-antitoxin system AbiEi family antitoxin [Nocardioides zeae]NEN78216.1 hypothetical protein [Nocardioides zeae]
MDGTTTAAVVGGVRDQLDQLGLRTRVARSRTGQPGASIELIAGGSSKQFEMLVAQPMNLTAVAAMGLEDRTARSRPILVVGARIQERSARAFRDLGIAYADTLGNASIRFDAVLIEVRGRRPDGEGGAVFDHPRHNVNDLRHEIGVGERTVRNMFSTSRSMVIATALAWPDLMHEPTRVLADAAGVSIGLAHETVKALDANGYLIGRRLRPDRVTELLDLWSAAYPNGLGSKLAIASYVSDKLRRVELSLDDITWPSDQPIVVSGEAVPDLSLRKRQSHTYYTPEWDPATAAKNRWRPVRDPREANIRIRRQFWTVPGPSVNERWSTAPWPIVYADLLAENDARLREVAAEWKARHARLF